MISNILSQDEEIPEEAGFIIGAGHFGTRAANLLIPRWKGPLYAIDIDEKNLSDLHGLPIKKIPCDGIQFLADRYHFLKPQNTIVPAIPLHLAFEWLRVFFDGTLSIEKAGIPDSIKLLMPNSWEGNEGSLLVSYADFLCPDDCPEPALCTVTGEKREQPLYELLRGLKVTDSKVYVIRSRQLAPGLGGYKLSELAKLERALKERGTEKRWLLGTACKCHGILTAFRVS